MRSLNFEGQQQECPIHLLWSRRCLSPRQRPRRLLSSFADFSTRLMPFPDPISCSICCLLAVVLTCPQPSKDWLQSLERICKKNGILLIVDDIQAGCGRTGDFFSFEFADISPDIVLLSKSLSGCGLPLSLFAAQTRIRRLATGRTQWDFQRQQSCTREGRILSERLREVAQSNRDLKLSVRGRGMMLGLDCSTGKLAEKIVRRAFEDGLVVERCGADGAVTFPTTIKFAVEHGMLAAQPVHYVTNHLRE
ncbi:aminotransferase class III-fold pyridoxal phosphate-dependent enzyme [Rhizobium lentis]|uniref:Adenosylmethionine-8-amino-7-oxononanoate aminotransferase n=1 Tax=Rhizobium lentis TaxID=1138194 RepID=A0A7W8XKV1_9HYPH|nr:adenosylmethionine-8-amino-7-oxononanoate aminotransferase [Rhizobium lentis]MBB5553219.1 adenosylmethionine-8-amino-7-oxononanoate aminotransferase [Rhizobium lentis]MBB5564728.1 adenosylmethionine-8-amino-7-oxononanoate aminotransferase [Rhizobium lentis]MBB5571318.1 adenosylmethionine-8-amino-7-oxononanoate aminotransferase [Rhizobium lentis]